MVTVAPISNFETNVTRKGRAGRPSQPGERYPSGKLKPADKREGGPAPAEIKRAFDKALRDSREPMIGTSLGLLMMRGDITTAQFAAGTSFARLFGQYDRAMGMPGRFTLSPDYGTARATSSREPPSETAVAAVKDRFRRTMGHLGIGWADSRPLGTVTVAGSAGVVKRLDGEAARSAQLSDRWRSVVLLERVCVDDLACEGYELDRLRAALQILVPWFGVGHQGR